MTAVAARPLPARPVTSVRGAAARLLVVALVTALVALGSLSAPASARPRQDPTTTTVADDAASTSAPATDLDAEAEQEESAGSRRVADENRRIWLVVAGLVVVALALSLLTFRYWRRTRPVPLGVDVEPEPEAEPEPATGLAALEARSRRGETGRRSRRAVAGADHAAVGDDWEPRGTGEHERVEVSAAQRLPRPTRDQRAAAYAARPR